ncbi:hypothetical protein [Paenibacillus sp. sgz500958]|uniref:hypothetical protein n=1 Tax=Paenibacillus sp. sgz500958 TaxID=3242475 RepID=UPI0036D2A1FA
MIRQALIFWSAVLLAVFGLVYQVMVGGLGALRGLIFPLIILVVLFYAYKIAPGSKSRNSSSRVKVKPSQKTMAKVTSMRKGHSTAGKRKSYPFQVIEGSKGKNDDQLPKYH